MTDQHEMTVTGMPHAYVTEDASRVELEFEGDDGDTIKLKFDADRFNQLSSRAIQMFTHVQNQKLATSAPHAIHAVEVVEATAFAAEGGSKVILGLRGNKGLDFHFALTPGLSDRLRKLMYDAGRAARKLASKPRH